MFSVNSKRTYDIMSLLGDFSSGGNAQTSCHSAAAQQLQNEPKPNCSSAASFYQSFMPSPSPTPVCEHQQTVPIPVQQNIRNGLPSNNVLSPATKWSASNNMAPAQVFQAFRGQFNSKQTTNGVTKSIKKPKRKRTMFTTDQVIALETIFKDRPYISKDERLQLSNSLNISETSVKVWFQNRRLKRKIESIEYTSDEEQEKINHYIARLNYIESRLSRIPCYNGFVPLDEDLLAELGKAINTALSGNVRVQMVILSPSNEMKEPVVKINSSDLTSDSSATRDTSSVADEMSPEELLEDLFRGVH